MILVYRINVTYNCNQACRWCYDHLDVAKWPDSDITLEDVEISGGMVRDLPVLRVRLSGGEPLLHPNFVEVYRAVERTWCYDDRATLRISTNGTVPRPPELDAQYRVSTPAGKRHKPWVVSPADMGIAVAHPGRDCMFARRCGLLFDAYGFSFCSMAGGMGRVLGIDPYSPHPVSRPNPRICRHCVFSLSDDRRHELEAEVLEKGTYPSETFRRGLDRLRSDPIRFKRFQERLQEEKFQ